MADEARELSDRKKKAIRRNSMILRETGAFEDSPKSPTKIANGTKTPPPRIAARPVSPKSGGAPDSDDEGAPPEEPPPDDDDDCVPPPALPPKSVKREDATLAMNTILSALLALDERLDEYRYSNDVLPTLLCEHFDGMHSAVTNMLAELRDLEQELKDYTQNDVDALLGGNIAKIYHSRRAQVFRQTVEPKKNRYINWHCPEYYGDSPCPPGSSVQVIIHLDEKAAVWGPWTLNCDAGDLAEGVIQQALVKATFAMSGLKGADYVLKMQGFNEYMKGPRRMMDYEYMRNCARKGIVAELWLVRLPPPRDDIPEVKAEPPTPSQAKRPPPPPTGAKVEEEDVWEKALPEKISVSELTIPFRVRVCGMENLPVSTIFGNSGVADPSISVEVVVFMGTTLLSDATMQTEPHRLSSHPRWMQWLSPGPGLTVNQLPRETRLGFFVWAGSDLVNWCSMPLLDESGMLVQGPLLLRMRPAPIGESAPKKAGKKKDQEAKAAEERSDVLEVLFRGPCGDGEYDGALLHLQFDEFMLPVHAPTPEEENDPATVARLAGLQTQGKEMAAALSNPKADKAQKEMAKQRDLLLKKDMLYKLSWADKNLLWNLRYSIMEEAHMLPFFLESVDWTKRDHRLEAQRLLTYWKPPLDSSTALRLLDVQFGDTKVREYAVKYLARLPPHKLMPLLLQLTQCLKFETYHRSALSNMLVAAGLEHPYTVGHYLFWHLKSEMATQPNIAERFTLIAEEFLGSAGPAVAELRKQHDAVLKLQSVAEMIVARIDAKRMSKPEIMAEYHDELRRLNKHFFDQRGNMQVPLNPKLEVGSLIVEKCRFMSSKKVPLWLVFKNADPREEKPVHIMFKSGDDLRQDMLTIQLLRFMDDIWLQDGLDMRLTPYRCIATGVNAQNEGVGMIELVLNADTTEGILRDFGGTMGAFKMTPLRDFLVKYNETPAKLEAANENFIRSCAGYCVATYVLGIGDRHSGNIMISKDGHLFHIDFGHFLGNKKKKMGVSRERDPFVFTQEMAFIVGGGQQKFTETASYKKFKELCGKAFNSLRQQSSMIETLFTLMVSAGMPELLKAEDVEFARTQLDLDLSDKEAAEVFMKAVDSAVSTTSRRIDNFFHELKHGKK